MGPLPAPIYVQVLIPKTCECDLIWGEMCRCDSVKDLQRRSFWISWASPKANDKCPCKGHRGEMQREEASAKTEAEMAGMWPQVQDHLEPPRAA